VIARSGTYTDLKERRHGRNPRYIHPDQQTIIDAGVALSAHLGAS
jgi:hypothetical protein